MIDNLKSKVQERDASAILEMIQNNSSILNESDENGSSGFMILAYAGLPEVLKEAIHLKSSFTFHEAIVTGKNDLIQDQLNVDATLVNKHSPDGFSPLSLAAFFDQNTIAETFLANGANPNLKATNPSQVNALHSAVAKENLELCKKLIEHGADVNATQMHGVTALHSAVHRGNLDLVKILIENGASSESKMDNGDTPISIAAQEGHSEVESFLNNSKS